MGNCKLCGSKAGFLRRRHKECQDINEKGRDQILQRVQAHLANEVSDVNTLNLDVSRIANESYVSADEVHRLLRQGFENSIKHALQDNVLSSKEELRLRDFQYV